MEQQIAKHILRHQLAKDTARIRQHVVATLRRIHQRLDSRVNGLNPLQAGKARQRIPNQFRFAEDDIALCRV